MSMTRNHPSRRSLCQRLAALTGAALLPAGAVCAADPAGALCGTAPAPAYPPQDKPPIIQTWLVDGHRDGPTPDCSALQGREFELLVRLTASLAAPPDADLMLTRLGAVSAMKNATYWSFTDHKRLALFKEAYAVDSATNLQARADFSAAELRHGQELTYVHSDNRSAKLMPYGMRLVKSTPDSLQLHIENLGELRMYGMLMLAAHETQWSVTLERLGAGRWGYRSLLAQRRLRMGRNEQHRLSNLARSAAMFDLLAGRQTDVEAPSRGAAPPTAAAPPTPPR